MMRVEGGELDMGKLAQVDALADEVVERAISPDDGTRGSTRSSPARREFGRALSTLVHGVTCGRARRVLRRLAPGRRARRRDRPHARPARAADRALDGSDARVRARRRGVRRIRRRRRVDAWSPRSRRRSSTLAALVILLPGHVADRRDDRARDAQPDRRHRAADVRGDRAARARRRRRARRRLASALVHVARRRRRRCPSARTGSRSSRRRSASRSLVQAQAARVRLDRRRRASSATSAAATAPRGSAARSACWSARSRSACCRTSTRGCSTVPRRSSRYRRCCCSCPAAWAFAAWRRCSTRTR